MTTLEDKTWSKYFFKQKIITVDPGKSGGIAVYSVEDGAIIALTVMPETPSDLFNFLKRYSRNSRVYMELVHGLPKMSGSGMFNFGKGFGHLEMALISLRIPFSEVRPQEWQKALGTGTKGHRTTNEWKTKLKDIAQKRWPSVERDFGLKNKGQWLSVSDALLIMEYARLKEKI